MKGPSESRRSTPVERSYKTRKPYKAQRVTTNRFCFTANMIQFKKIPLSKSVILLILFLTTTTTGLLRNNEDEQRATRDDGNVRETILSMDRREENIQVQNLPIRKLDINREINEKDSIAERLYDRRSFRTGTIEQISHNRETIRVSRDVRDVNNNRREIARSNNRREDRRQIRETSSERAVISRNRHLGEERRLFNIRTDRRNTERRALPEHRVLSNRLASEFDSLNIRGRNVRQSSNQARRTTNLQSRFVDVISGAQNRQSDYRMETTREVNPTNRRSVERDIQQRSTRDNQIIKVGAFEDSSRRSLEDSRITVRSENQDRRFSQALIVDQIKSSETLRSTERLVRSNSREIRTNMVGRRTSEQRREDNEPRRIHTRSNRVTIEPPQFSTSAERQNRRYSERNIDQNIPFEDRRTTARSLQNQDRTSSLVRAVDRNQPSNRMSSERHNIHLNVPLEDRRITGRSLENQDRTASLVRAADRTQPLDRQRTVRMSSERRNIERNVPLEDRQVTARSLENQDQRSSLLARAVDRTQPLDRQRSVRMSSERRNIERIAPLDDRRITARSLENQDRRFSLLARAVDRPQPLDRQRSIRTSSEQRNVERNVPLEDRRVTARSLENQDRRSSLLARAVDRTQPLDRQRTIRMSSERRNVERNAPLEDRRITTRSIENQERRSSLLARAVDRTQPLAIQRSVRMSFERRNVERNASPEDRRITARSIENQERRSSLLARAVDRTQPLDRQRSIRMSSERRNVERNVPLEERRITARSLENQDRRSSLLARAVDRTQPMDRQRSIRMSSERRNIERNVPLEDRRITDQSFENQDRKSSPARAVDGTQSMYKPRSARMSSERRNNERNVPFEDRRITARSVENQNRRYSLGRAVDRTQSLDSQSSTRLSTERRNIERNIPLEHRRITARSLENQDRRSPARAVDRTQPLDGQRSARMPSGRRNIERNMPLQDRQITDRSVVNQGRRFSLVRAEDRTQPLNLQKSARMSNERRNIKRHMPLADRRIIGRFSKNQDQRFSLTRVVDRSQPLNRQRSAKMSSERRNIERNVPLGNRRITARSLENQVRRSSRVQTADRTRSVGRQTSIERLGRTRQPVRNFLEMSAFNRLDRQRNLVQTRDVYQRRQRNVEGRESLISSEDRVRDDSRSDSTRYIKDNTQFRRDSRANIYAKQRLNTDSVIVDRYNQLTADSRRYFEKLVSQRSIIPKERAARSTADLKIVDSNIWANTAKILLAAFLIGQMFVNSSKQNKFRFHNIMSMASFAKEKIQ